MVAMALVGRNVPADPRAAGAGASASGSGELGHAQASEGHATFAGRERELAIIGEAYAEVCEGEARVVLVRGESGLGKSALVAELVSRLVYEEPVPLVLAGRCYEDEQAPFQAFDAVMRELSQTLRALPQEDCAALLPPHAALLPQLFPVLGAVPAIAALSKDALPAEPLAQRLRAFGALRTLLSSFCALRPVVLSLEDLQWADAESFRLLEALVADAFAPPMLVLCTVRPRAEIDPDVGALIDAFEAQTDADEVLLAPLSLDEAERVAAQLLGPAAPAAWARVVAEESEGHPLFLRELARYARSAEGPSHAGTLSLDDAVLANIRGLDAHTRALLDLLALAGRPHPVHVLERALGRPLGDAAARLVSDGLARTGRGRTLGCDHDRIRRAAVGAIDPTQRPRLAAALAAALELEQENDPSDLARLWDAAREPARARDAYERAADRALAGLAFAQAERLYARALTLQDDARDDAWRRLVVRRGDALARLGRAADAADAYGKAAEHASGEERTRLRIGAAEQLIQSARVDEGLRIARELLSELGAPLPRGTAGALARIAWDRTCIRVRGLEVQPRATCDVPTSERLLLDALQQLSFPVSWVALLPGSALNTLHLRRALSVGEPGHVARALSQEAVVRALQAPDRVDTYAPLFERSKALLPHAGEPALEAMYLLFVGSTALFRFDLEAARVALEQANELVQTSCAGEAWLRTNIRMTLCGIWWSLGAHQRLAQTADEWMAEARERKDAFAQASIGAMGLGCVRHLVQDAPDAARKEIEDALAPWPVEPFGLAHIGELYAVAHIELYRGGAGAKAFYDVHVPRFERAFVSKVRYFRGFMARYRALGALAACVVAERSERRVRLDEARAAALSLHRTTFGGAEAFEDLVDAQIAALEGRLEPALSLAHRASERFSRIGFGWLASSAAYLAGRLEGGDGGRARQQAALQAYTREGYRDPRRAVTMFVPAARLSR